DRLAQEGRILTNFHATPLCATSRAELLTGADHHLVGVGTLPESTSFYAPTDENYKGELNGNARTVAQVLKDAGYHTYIAGTWHRGSGGPAIWGLEQSLSMQYTSAFGNNYAATPQRSESAARGYFENGKQITIPSDFYSSDYFVDKLKGYIGGGHG